MLGAVFAGKQAFNRQQLHTGIFLAGNASALCFYFAGGVVAAGAGTGGVGVGVPALS
jgi:hypothetical protein